MLAKPELLQYIPAGRALTDSLAYMQILPHLLAVFGASQPTDSGLKSSHKCIFPFGGILTYQEAAMQLQYSIPAAEVVMHSNRAFLSSSSLINKHWGSESPIPQLV